MVIFHSYVSSPEGSHKKHQAPPTGAVTVQIRGSREARVDSRHLDVLVVVNAD